MPRLLAVVRARLRLRHLSSATERAYVAWIRRFVRFCGNRHPLSCGEPEVRGFLEHLATRGKVSASTQNQALAALLFLYRALDRPIGQVQHALAAKRRARVPNVLDQEEIIRLLGSLRGDARLIAMLLYGAGLRLNEALSLRLKDVDLTRRVVTVRGAKGNRDRRTVLPEAAFRSLARKV